MNASQKAPRPSFAAQTIGNMIAVASGKGGVGKTWLSTTLSNAFALQGDRILLVDGDLGLANVDVQLGLTPACDLGAVIAGRAAMEEAITEYEGGAGARDTAHRGGGFDVLAGQSGSGALANLSGAEMMGMIQALRALSNTYDRVIVDLGAGIDRAVTALSAMSGATLVVLTDEPTSLTDAYAFIKVMSSRAQEADIRIVVNAAENEDQGRKTYEALAKACQSFLDVSPSLAGIVVRDPKVKEAIRAQTALLTRHPSSPAGLCVSRIAAQLRLS